VPAITQIIDIRLKGQAYRPRDIIDPAMVQKTPVAKRDPTLEASILLKKG